MTQQNRVLTQIHHFIFINIFCFSDHSDDNEEDKLRYNRFIQKGKELGRQGHLERALQLFEKACAIFESEKLLRRIEKIKVKFHMIWGLSKKVSRLRVFFFAGTEFTTDLLSALSCLELIGRCHSVPEVVVVFRSMSLSEQLNTYPSPNPT